MIRTGSILVLGFALALVVGLSVHVVMLQVFGVPYPDHSGVPVAPKFLNTWMSVLALLVFYQLARERLSMLSVIASCIVVFALYAMTKEALIRAPVMDGVVTTAWIFSWVKALPRILSFLIIGSAVVLAAPFLKRPWQELLFALALAAAMFFAVDPLLQARFGEILSAIASLAHDDVYQMPYGLEVLVPAYLTYAEPVFAAFAVAALIWDKLSANVPYRVFQFSILVMAMRGTLLPLILFSPFLSLDLPQALASEAQFFLETLAVAVITAIAWHYSGLKRRFEN